MNHARPNMTIAACCALSAALGSIHAFSVFNPEWESVLKADRASVSFIYSVSLVSLTAAVLAGYRLYQRLSPLAIFLTVGLLSFIGLTLSAHVSSLLWLYLGYGCIFGCANGLGYGYALQLAGQTAVRRRGLAMTLVTAFYAVGATASPLVFVALINNGGNTQALQFIAVAVLTVAVTCAMLLRWAGAKYEGEVSTTITSLSGDLSRARILLWISYGCAVTAGLMIIGHAFNIAVWANLDNRSAGWATTAVAFFNMLGGFCAGYFSERIATRLLIKWLPVFTCAGLLILVIANIGVGPIAFVGLAIVGYSYGAIIAIYPVTVSEIFGSVSAARIYGQIFTAWGLAGFVGPYLSGLLYDKTGSYNTALIMAVFLSILSVVALRFIQTKNF